MNESIISGITTDQLFMIGYTCLIGLMVVMFLVELWYIRRKNSIIAMEKRRLARELLREMKGVACTSRVNPLFLKGKQVDKVLYVTSHEDGV